MFPLIFFIFLRSEEQKWCCEHEIVESDVVKYSFAMTCCQQTTNSSNEFFKTLREKMKKLTQLTFLPRIYKFLIRFNLVSCLIFSLLCFFCCYFNFTLNSNSWLSPSLMTRWKKRWWRRREEQEQGGNLEFLLTNWFIFICTLEPCANARRYKYGEKIKTTARMYYKFAYS